jgi:pilus assembly protein CpaB
MTRSWQRLTDTRGALGGFVLPGDHVDVALTRQIDRETASTQVVLQNARVLATDQVADERAATPAVAKSVTLEVDTVSADKLGLAASIGTLSLQLRNASETTLENTPRVSIKDLFSDVVAEIARRNTTTTVTIRRNMQADSYSVPIVTVEGRAFANSEGQPH